MKAVIAGTAIDVEGEPAEIAQLVELCATGAVMVEHKHHWKIGELDGSATVVGTCWCGASREFNPVAPEYTPQQMNSLAFATDAASATAAAARRATGPRPKCEACGRNHQPGKCKTVSTNGAKAAP